MAVCDDPVVNCDTCFEVLIGDCLATITLSLGLTPSTLFFFRLIDKSGREYDFTATTDGSGDFTIDKTQLPDDLINQFAGDFELQIFSDSNRTVLVTVTQNSIIYNCVLLVQQLSGSNNIKPPSIRATGGTVTIDGLFTIHTFTSSGTFTVTRGGNVEFLVVAGGGGGGSSKSGGGGSGGGGAGGFQTANGFAITPQDFAITVGAGGAGGVGDNGQGTNGSDSIFSTIISTGGGGGGGASGGQTGNSGGSGGGGGANANAGGTGTAGQGNDGGNAFGSRGGGGGGASQAGQDAGIPVNNGGDGGDGTSSSISGVSTDFAGGGGGGSNVGPGPGGLGGGGSANSGNATVNTGGGGAGTFGNNNSGDGGSGIVIIRYPT